MTDPRIAKIEAARNEIKNLAADLHTLSYQEVHARTDSILKNILKEETKSDGWSFLHNGHEFLRFVQPE